MWFAEVPAEGTNHSKYNKSTLGGYQNKPIF